MEIMKLLAVFGLGIVELWAAIPAGLAWGVHPVATGITAALGAVAGVFIVLALGEGLRKWLLRRHHRGREEKQPGRIHRVWARYGVAGLGLLAPLLVGAPVGTALGLALGAPRKRLVLWMVIGIVAWSAGLAIVSALGLAGIKTLWH